MGKKDRTKKKIKGAEKTLLKTEKKAEAKQKRMLAKLGEADIAEVVKGLEEEDARIKSITEEVCPQPTPRSNFSLAAHPEKEALILFGGEFFNGKEIVFYKDLFFYDISKNEWKQLRSPSGPTPRSSHQMVALPADGGQIWIFGGEYASPSQLQFHHYKDLWMMSFKTRKWEKVNAPNGPSARSGHRMVAAKRRLIVFGGFHDNNRSCQYFNDVHMFSLDSYSWLEIDIGGVLQPQPRSGCCMFAFPDGKVLVWGGYSKVQSKKAESGMTHTDMFALMPDKHNHDKKFIWTTVKQSGYKPPPLSSVGFVASANGSKVFCFGGILDDFENEEDVNGKCRAELTFLDTQKLSWRLIQIGNRDDEAVAASQNNAEGPSPRMNAGLCICKGKLYLYGGIQESNKSTITLNDLYVIDVHKLDKWKVVIPYGIKHEWLESDDSDSESSEMGKDGSNESDDDGDDDESSKDSDSSEMSVDD